MARQNAEQSSLDHLPIRWIVEDAVLFVERELRRGNRYEMIVLDPPLSDMALKVNAGKLTHQIEDFLTIVANCYPNMPKESCSPVTAMTKLLNVGCGGFWSGPTKIRER